MEKNQITQIAAIRQAYNNTGLDYVNLAGWSSVVRELHRLGYQIVRDTDIDH